MLETGLMNSPMMMCDVKNFGGRTEGHVFVMSILSLGLQYIRVVDACVGTVHRITLANHLAHDRLVRLKHSGVSDYTKQRKSWRPPARSNGNEFASKEESVDNCKIQVELEVQIE